MTDHTPVRVDVSPSWKADAAHSCGKASPLLEQVAATGRWRVSCYGCGLMSFEHDDADNAVSAWLNAQAPITEALATIERLTKESADKTFSINHLCAEIGVARSERDALQSDAAIGKAVREPSAELVQRIDVAMSKEFDLHRGEPFCGRAMTNAALKAIASYPHKESEHG